MTLAWSEKGVRLAQNMQVGHAFLWECSYKRLRLAQLLGQLGVFLTLAGASTQIQLSRWKASRLHSRRASSAACHGGAGTGPPSQSSRRSKQACIDEGALSFLTTIFSSFRDSPYKRERGGRMTECPRRGGPMFMCREPPRQSIGIISSHIPKPMSPDLG